MESFRGRCSLALEGEEANVTRALDGAGQLALVLRADARDAARQDLATLGHELAQTHHVLVIDVLNLLRQEGADFATREATARTARTATEAATGATLGTATFRTAAFGATTLGTTTAALIGLGNVLTHFSLCSCSSKNAGAAAQNGRSSSVWSSCGKSLPAGADERVTVLLERLGFRIYHPALKRQDADGQLSLLTGLADFQEHLGGELTITLLKGLGTGFEVHDMNPDLITQAIDWLAAREAV